MKKFKLKSENTMRKLVATALIIGGTAILPGSGVNMSKELPTCSIEEMVIYYNPPKEIKFMTSREIKPYLDMAFKEVNLPSYIDKNYVQAKILVESHGNPEAVSSIGAKGLMQIMPSTWSDYDSANYWENVFNPEKNILVSLKHLKKIDEYLQENFPGYSSLPNREKQDKISAVYNAGITKMRKANWDVSKMSEETQNHVEKIRRILGG